MIDDGDFSSTGLILISQAQAIDLTTKLCELGKDYFIYTSPQFENLMSKITAAIPCQVLFKSLLNNCGYYDRTKKQIVVASNKSQITMIWSLVHECAHFLLSSNRIVPHTYEEYMLDEEEHICNYIAQRFITENVDGDFIKTIIESALGKINNVIPKKQDDWDSLGEEDIISLEERLWINYIISREMLYLKKEEELIKLENSVYDRFCVFLKSQMGKKIAPRIDCRQTGLVVLSLRENKKLYNIIMNEISDMMPSEDDWED